MKSLSTQLSIYKSVHLDNKNIATHFVGVPLILWSVALLLSTVGIEVNDLKVNLMHLVATIVFLYYLLLDIRMGVIAVALMGPIFYFAQTFTNVESPYLLAVGVFFVGWVFQFIGHFFEKAKPAFFDDIKQLFIGPLFLVAEVCFAVGLFKDLESKVTKDAQQMRIDLDHA